MRQGLLGSRIIGIETEGCLKRLAGIRLLAGREIGLTKPVVDLLKPGILVRQRTRRQLLQDRKRIWQILVQMNQRSCAI